MVHFHFHCSPGSPAHPAQLLVHRCKARTWARLIREAETLWRTDVRPLQWLGAIELKRLQEETPRRLRPYVNSWLRCYRALTQLPVVDPPGQRPKHGHTMKRHLSLI